MDDDSPVRGRVQKLVLRAIEDLEQAGVPAIAYRVWRVVARDLADDMAPNRASVTFALRRLVDMGVLVAVAQRVELRAGPATTTVYRLAETSAGHDDA